MKVILESVGELILAANIIFLASVPALMVIIHDRDAAINKHHPHTPFCLEGMCVDTTLIE